MNTELLFQLAYAPMSLPVLLIDERGTIVCVNRSLCQRFGYAPQDLIQQPVETLLPQRFRAGHPVHIRGFFLKPQNRSLDFSGKFWGCTKAGEEFPVEISIHHLFADEGAFAVGTIVDMNKVRLFESQLQEEKLKLAMAIKSSGLGVWTWNVVTGNITWDDRMFEMYEVPRKEFMSYEDWRKRIHPSDAPQAESSLALAHQQKKPWQAEFRLLMDNGDVKYISASNQPIIDPITQEVVRVIGANLEMTEIREREALLQEKSKEVEAFAQRVAHDLRGSIGAAISLSSLLDPNDPSDYAEIVPRIQNSLKNCTRIIEGLYKLSGISGSKIKLKSSDLSIAYQATLLAIQKESHERNAVIKVELNHSASFDQETLPQVLQNLITNAMRHYEGKDHPVIWVHSERIKDRVLIHVEDNGPGIPLEHRSKIFRAFERLNPDKCEGLGLGLSISKKIIELHGGSISVSNSRELGGCKFSFDLTSESFN